MRRATRRLHWLLVLLCLGGLAAASEPSNWCPAPVAPYDASEPLAWGAIGPLTKQAVEQADLQEIRRIVSREWMAYVAAHSLGGSRIRAVTRALADFFSSSPPPWAIWRAVPGDGLTLDLSVLDQDLVELDCDDFGAEERGIANLAHTLFTLGDVYRKPYATLAADQVATAYQLHFARLKNGLPMWPHEMFVNGLGRKAYDSSVNRGPPAHQWIVLRPNTFAALKFAGVENSQLDLAFGLEPFGLVWYRDRRTFRKWAGASALVAVSNDNGVGYGALLRWNAWSLGAAYHKKDSRFLMYLNVDLYTLILGDKTTNSADEWLSGLVEHVKSRRTPAPLDEK